MRKLLLLVLVGFAAGNVVRAVSYENKPKDPYFDKFQPLKAPKPMKHFLREGDRLAICGDSITEQRMYSRIMETYLTVCAPELNVSVRQYGWSGEKAPGFLGRMTNDCLRFNPTIATTCYGMNDHEYRTFEPAIGTLYSNTSVRIIESFKAHGARVVQGSPGCVGKRPGWTKATNSTTEDLNLNLCALRNIGIEVAKKEKEAFADVFWPMLVEGHEAMLKYGDGYALPGKDGVHPGWAGHLVMAYAFLHSFGLEGDIGTFTVDLGRNSAKVSAGHELIGFENGELRVTSHKYPFCIGDGDPAKDDNIRSGTMLVPFNEELNRLTLVAKHGKAKAYKVTWGEGSKVYSARELARGVNLAADFGRNPFSDAFKRVDDAVAKKQEFETHQIKAVFHGPQGKADMEGVAVSTEKERAPLAAAIKEAFVPVTHTIKIEAQ
jgi:lysophospholipase L1-like esterase